MKGNTKMFKVYLDLKTRKNIFPFSSEIGAIYFATSLREYAEGRHEYLPAIDIINDETGEVIYQQMEITPCDWMKYEDLMKVILTDDSPCKICLRQECGLRGLTQPW
jgi:hypothetical protein